MEDDKANTKQFDLFRKTTVSEESNEESTAKYVTTHYADLDLKIRECQQSAISLSDLTSFDNTGNVRMWPSEEIAAFWCFQNARLFQSKSVLEIASGMIGLIGLTIIKSQQNELDNTDNFVMITDGNENCIKSVEENIILNFGVNPKKYDANPLLWADSQDFKQKVGQFDVIIGSDCLFLEQYHADLVALLDVLLKPQGNCYIFAPNRGDSMKRFIERAVHAGLGVEQTINYNEKIWNEYLRTKNHIDPSSCPFDFDRNYPILIHIAKSKTD